MRLIHRRQQRFSFLSTESLPLELARPGPAATQYLQQWGLARPLGDLNFLSQPVQLRSGLRPTRLGFVTFPRVLYAQHYRHYLQETLKW